MNERELQKLLESVRSGEVSPARGLERLKHLPFEDLGFAKVDHHRALRQGYAEVIFGKARRRSRWPKLCVQWCGIKMDGKIF